MNAFESRVTAEVTEDLSGHELVEVGTGLVAQGLFRIAKREGHKSAAKTASAVVSTFRDIWLDMERNASNEDSSAG